VAYGVAVRPWTRRAVAFVAGVVVLLLALISPIDVLGDSYLFSAHMLQHLLLMLAVPPLLLYGIPPHAFAGLLSQPMAERIERVLGRPLVAWLIGIGTLWVWHAPPLYDLALRYEGVHIVQHLCFLVAATIFWWPVIAPLTERRRLSSFAAMPYLLLAALSSSVLGIVITFAPVGLYAPYLHPFDRLGALALIRGQWHFSAQSDQQLGGTMMWILSSPVYLAATALALARWYAEGEEDEAEAPPAPTRATPGMPSRL
jgi:cytochrome c oxidase assembly factor CtaG